jgi:hypothetical protein
MVARVARFEGIDMAQAEKDIPAVEAIVGSLIEGLSGYRGVVNLWSSDGNMITVTLFESETDATAAEPVFDEEMPAKLGSYFASWKGHRVEAGVYNASVKLP